MILFPSALEFEDNKKINMNNLIIDAAGEKIFLMIIKSKNIYSVSHENSKTNYESLSLLIGDFIKNYELKIDEISKIFVNRGPGSFAGIRNIDYYCFSFEDFGKLDKYKYENIPILCNKLKIKKNLINPIYLR